MKFLLSSGLAYRCLTNLEIQQLALNLDYDGLELMMPPLRLTSHHKTDRDDKYSNLQALKGIHTPFLTFFKKDYSRSLDCAIRVAQATDVPLINTHPYSMRLMFGGRPAQEKAAAKIKKLEKNTGLTIAVEVMNKPRPPLSKLWRRYLQQPFKHPDEWVAYIKKHNLHATLDTTHIATWGLNPTDYIEKLGSRLCHVHFSDYKKAIDKEHLIPGTGDIDCEAFLKALRQVAPNITVTVELNPFDTKEEVAYNAQQSISYIQRALA